MSLSEVLQWNVALFFLIFSRWAGMVMLAPVFGARGVPTAVRLGITASLSLIMYPMIRSLQPVVPSDFLPYSGILIKETLVGLVVGFVVYTLSAILEGAGQLVDMQMGFAMANTIDPVYGMQSPMMGNFQMILATMILLATNAHHFLIAAMVKSYAYIPINPSLIQMEPGFYINLMQNIFMLSVQVALPVFGAILLSDIGVGLLSRTVPQLNIFAVVFPVKIIFGLFILIFALPFFGETVSHLFNLTMNWLLVLYQGWSS